MTIVGVVESGAVWDDANRSGLDFDLRSMDMPVFVLSSTVILRLFFVWIMLITTGNRRTLCYTLRDVTVSAAYADNNRNLVT